MSIFNSQNSRRGLWRWGVGFIAFASSQVLAASSAYHSFPTPKPSVSPRQHQAPVSMEAPPPLQPTALGEAVPNTQVINNTLNTKITTTPQVYAVIPKLMLLADNALKQGRLMQPPQDNAYDRLRAVLLLNPNHTEAKAKLDSIQQYCVQRVTMAIEQNNLVQANAELARAQQYFPRSPLLTPLASQLRAKNIQVQRAVQREEATLVSVSNDVQRLSLPDQALRQKNEEVKNLLQQVAQRVKQSDEAIVIFARNDAEGRWIYQTMRNYCSDYRIRGDIRIAQRPAIEFLTPIQESN